MVRQSDPTTIPIWQALHRESSLVSQLIASGVTSLGQATYGTGFGHYYQAFFSISIGVERLAKLIVVADRLIRDDSAPITQKTLRSFGHNISELLNSANIIAQASSLRMTVTKPDDPICHSMVEFLDHFADAARGRYANFRFLDAPAYDFASEPINKWWRDVVCPILDKHFRGTEHQKLVRHKARVLRSSFGDSVDVFHFGEDGAIISDIFSATERSGEAEWAQKYSRFYMLIIVRWLSEIFEKLCTIERDGRRVDLLFGHAEFFSTFLVKDKFMRERKKWPLT